MEINKLIMPIERIVKYILCTAEIAANSLTIVSLGKEASIQSTQICLKGKGELTGYKST